MRKEYHGAITAHFITFFGVPSAIHPRQIREVGDVAILEFAPSRTRKTWRYATNGMGACPQHNRSIAVRTELYTTTFQQRPWAVELLLAIASYPFERRTYLAEGDSIEVGQPIDRDASPYTGILLARPGLDDPPTMGMVGGTEETLLVHQVLPLYPSEVQYAAEGNGERLCKLIKAQGTVALDGGRPNLL